MAHNYVELGLDRNDVVSDDDGERLQEEEDSHTAPEHPGGGHEGGGGLQVPGRTHEQQTKLQDQHRGWIQKGMSRL